MRDYTSKFKSTINNKLYEFCAHKVPKINFLNFIKSFFILKSTYKKISLNYGLVHAGALGALGRRFESCRPDKL